MQTHAPQQSPPVQISPQYASAQPTPSAYTPKKSHTGRNLTIGCLGLIASVIVLAIIGSNANTSTNNTTSSSIETPPPSPSPISEAQYKASGKAIPYVQLEKDPTSLVGTVVVYTGQVIQYDSATGLSNLRVDVTPDGLGGYTDTIWLDVDPAQMTKVFRDTIIKFWGTVVGPHTYTSVTGAQITIPEVDARYVQVER